MINSSFFLHLKTTLKITLLLSSSTLLTSCAIYDARFSCPDSKGARCSMLSRVDQMVDSGEIETIHQTRLPKNVPLLNTKNKSSIEFVGETNKSLEVK